MFLRRNTQNISTRVFGGALVFLYMTYLQISCSFIENYFQVSSDVRLSMKTIRCLIISIAI